MEARAAATGVLGFLRRRWIGPSLVFLIAALAIVANARQGARLDPVGALVADAFQRAAPRPYDPGAPVRIVAIDEASLKQFGQWPWPRTYVAELVRRLTALGAAAIAFDVLFADRDRTSPELVAEASRRFERDAPPTVRLIDHARHDVLLSRAIAEAPVVLGAVPSDLAPGETAAPLDRKFGIAFAGSDTRARMVAIAEAVRPLPILLENAQGYGVAGVGVGESAVVRREQLFSRLGGEIAPSLTMEALRVAQGAGGYVIKSSDASAESAGGAAPAPIEARNGAIVLPLTADGAMWIRYAGERPERLLPAWRVLEGEDADEALRPYVEGQIVLVGATAPGLRYVVETPLSSGVDAVTVHAETLEQILAGVALQRPDWAPGVETLAIVLGALGAFAAAQTRSAAIASVAAPLLVAGFVGAAGVAFTRFDLILSPVYPAISAAGCYVALTALSFVRSKRESGAIRAQFARFVAPEVVQELVADPDRRVGVGGASRELTVLFTDARGFTTLSEKMTPDTLIDYLNAILSAQSDDVFAEGGTVDKYIGDSVMAFWNAPIAVEDHVDRALRTIFAIRETQHRLNVAFEKQGLPPVDLGCGLNTGIANVGLMGSNRRLEYSCVGDTVNVAARLQDLTKTYGVWNVVGEGTVSRASGWEAVALDVMAVRGRVRTERIYTVVAPKRGPRADLDAFRAALAAAQEAVRTGVDVERALDRLRSTAIPELDSDKMADALEKRRVKEAA
jgi:adenylate cyclase